jgi:hypothetical protein
MKRDPGQRVEATPRRIAGDGGVAATESSAREIETENPGVPGFRTWRGLYWFVLIAFVVVVLLLTFFSRLFA